jgi:hypothetical protein
MALKKNTPEAETETVERQEVDYRQVPGFHVIQGDTHLGTYESEDEAQMFIDGHLKPNNLKATIVEGSSDGED